MRVIVFVSATRDYFPVDMTTPIVLGLLLAGLVLTVMVAWPRLRKPAPPTPARRKREAEAAAEEEADAEITIEGHYLPFGPYLAMAGTLYMFIGPEAVARYQQYLQSPLGT